PAAGGGGGAARPQRVVLQLNKFEPVPLKFQVLRKKHLHGAIGEPPKNPEKIPRHDPKNPARCAKCGPTAQHRTLCRRLAPMPRKPTATRSARQTFDLQLRASEMVPVPLVTPVPPRPPPR